MSEHERPAGWYPDEHGIVRWWDGNQWTQNTAPGTTTATETRRPRNGLGTAGFILGLIGAVFGLLPFTFWVAGTLGLIGVILALVGRKRVKREEASNGKIAWAGIILSVIALGLSVWGAVVVITAVDEATDEINEALEELEGNGDPAPAVDDPAADEDGATEDPPADAGGAAGSRENPHPAGTTADLGEWQVSFGAALADGNELIAAENEFNTPPADGHEFVVAPVSATYSGDASGTAWIDLTIEFVSSTGNTYDSLCDGNVIPDSLMDDGEQLPGASVDGNVCAAVPADQIDGGTWVISDAMSLDSTETYFARS